MHLTKKNIMRCVTLIAVLILCSCKPNYKIEDPYKLSQQFCDCMEKHQTKNGEFFKSRYCDTAIFAKSRFFKIRFSNTRDSFSKETLDSAEAFFNTVSHILDSTCYSNNYLKNRKLNK